ncbi:hypothetical protein SUGI_0800180 [Cryptomeria japonica]|nr:hypothetical protein SUGI_0800180 [Cryptomeria japonica]
MRCMWATNEARVFLSLQSLHLSCANFPMKVNHPHHPEHTLKLYFIPPYEDKSSTCYVSNKRCKALWNYHCLECLYDVHVTYTHFLRHDPMNQFLENYTE